VISLPRFARRLPPALLTALLLVTPAFAAPEKWFGEIDQFIMRDAVSPPPPESVVFVGSSSIRLWTSLAQDFRGLSTVNRGFGGSELSDTLFYADRIILPYKPRVVVIYAGENDLWAGKAPETILNDFQMLRSKIHAALPATRIIYLSIKESPRRARIRPQVQLTNKLMSIDCLGDPRCRFVDVTTPLLGPGGQARPELFSEDQVHLLPAGYAIWAGVLLPYLYQ
jgi:lysophospholipase L1-like esterase